MEVELKRLNRVKGLRQVISNLQESTYYDVTIQAYTVGVGPAASIRVAAHAISKLLSN